jgi:hypothetical protein
LAAPNDTHAILGAFVLAVPVTAAWTLLRQPGISTFLTPVHGSDRDDWIRHYVHFSVLLVARADAIDLLIGCWSLSLSCLQKSQEKR